MKLQIDFPKNVNTELKLAKAIYEFDTLQQTVIAFCEKELKTYIEKGRKLNGSKSSD